MAWSHKTMLACLLLQLARSIHAAASAAQQERHSVQIDSKRHPLAGYEGTWEGNCVHYSYGPVDESGRWVCAESPVTYPMTWVIKRSGSQYSVTAMQDKTTIEHGDKVYSIPKSAFTDVLLTYKYSDDFGHCVHADAGTNMYGDLRIGVWQQGNDTVLVEDGHWYLVPTKDGEVVRCPPKSAYVSPTLCSPDDNVLGFKCTYYKRS